MLRVIIATPWLLIVQILIQSSWLSLCCNNNRWLYRWLLLLLGLIAIIQRDVSAVVVMGNIWWVQLLTSLGDVVRIAITIVRIKVVCAVLHLD